MSFTDDDLKQLKKQLCESSGNYPIAKLQDLVARMEAAERSITNLLIIADSAENHDQIMEALREWRDSKAVGK